MSERKDNGGQASPAVVSDHECDWAVAGMSLRDYFAAHAPDPPTWWWKGRGGTDASMLRRLADWPWIYADAMLEAREYESAKS